MLHATQLAGFGGISSAIPSTPFVQYNGRSSDILNQTTYTFFNFPVGAAYGNKLVVVCVTGGSVSGTIGVSSGTIGGVSATVHVSGSGATDFAGIMSAPFSGETANISVSATNTCSRIGVTVYSIYNLTSYTPFGSVQESGSTSGVQTNSLNVPANGVIIIGGCWMNTISGTFSASGVTFIEDAQFVIETTHCMVSAHVQYPTSAASPLSITATGGLNATDCDFAAASWR